MAQATFHSERGEKSALIMVKANALQFNASPVYVPREAVIALCKAQGVKVEKNAQFKIDDGFKLIDMVDENGDPRTTESGAHLKTLSYDA